MASFNKVICLANLTRDPALRFTASQVPVVEFGIAMNRRYRTQGGEDKEEVCFVDCTAFSKTAELISQHFSKGKPIFIEGRLKWDSWEDKNGGGKRSKLTVIVENLQFVGSKRDADGGGDEQDGGGSANEPRSTVGAGAGRQRTRAVEPPFGDEKQFDIEDIPFLHRQPERSPI